MELGMTQKEIDKMSSTEVQEYLALIQAHNSPPKEKLGKYGT